MKRFAIHLLYTLLPGFLPRFVFGKNQSTGISTLLCHEHVPKFVYAVSSLFYYGRFSVPLFVVDDGSLTRADCVLLSRLFTVRIERVESADRKMKKLLRRYPHFFAYRFDEHNAVTKKKWDAYLLSPFSRVLYLDPDIIFFRMPNKLCEWMRDQKPVFFHLEHAKEELGADQREDTDFSFRSFFHENGYPLVSPSFNTGLLGIPSTSAFPLKKLDSIFHEFEKHLYTRAFTAEETAVAMSLVDAPRVALSPTHYVCVARNSEYAIIEKMVRKQTVTLVHYIGETDEFFARDAVRVALRTGLFRRTP